MQTIEIQTTQNVNIEYPIASAGERIVAALIDQIILIGYLIAVIFFYIWLINTTEGSSFHFPVAYFVILFLPYFFTSLLQRNPGYVLVRFAFSGVVYLIDHAGDMGDGNIKVSQAIDVAQNGDIADGAAKRLELGGHRAGFPAEADTAVDDANGFLAFESLYQAFFREGPVQS